MKSRERGHKSFDHYISALLMTSPCMKIKIMTSPISVGLLSCGRNNWGHNNSLLSDRISSSIRKW